MKLECLEITYFSIFTTYFAVFDYINITYFGPKNYIFLQALVIRQALKLSKDDFQNSIGWAIVRILNGLIQKPR